MQNNRTAMRFCRNNAVARTGHALAPYMAGYLSCSRNSRAAMATIITPETMLTFCAI